MECAIQHQENASGWEGLHQGGDACSHLARQYALSTQPIRVETLVGWSYMLPSQLAEGFRNGRVGHWINAKICEVLEKLGPVGPVASLQWAQQSTA